MRGLRSRKARLSELGTRSFLALLLSGGMALAGSGEALPKSAVSVIEPIGAMAGHAFSFASIDGGMIDLADHSGRPILVVNTASLCGFTPQYDELQALHDRFAARGLLVLAVPSDDFRQELASAEAVKEFCAVNFDLTLPMTDITSVKGANAHPFYRWVAAETGFVPGWNFNKVLIGPEGAVLGTWGSAVKPMSQSIVGKIEPLLK
jgi:glutathione peroxidase